ncbi:MAG: hypothetical protein AAF512_11700 [Pseudomonadota bacterium]
MMSQKTLEMLTTHKWNCLIRKSIKTAAVVLFGFAAQLSAVELSNLDGSRGDTSSKTTQSLAAFGIDPMDLANYTSAQIEMTPLAVFPLFDASNVGALPASAIASLSAEQFGQISDAALSGLTCAQIASLSLSVIDAITSADLASFSADQTIQGTPCKLLRLLTNMNRQRVAPSDITRLLPSGWSIDQSTGELTVPTGTPLSFRALSLSGLPTNLTVPAELPDFTTSFGLGGQGGPTLISGMNTALAVAGLEAAQFTQVNGILIISGSAFDVSLAFIADGVRMVQVETSFATLKTLEGTQYAPVTPGGQQIPLIPGPGDPVGIANLLGTGTHVSMGAGGEVTLATGDSRTVVLCDSVVFPAGDATPGLQLFPNRRMEAPLGQAVLQSGVAQQFFPYFPQPETFRQTALALSPLIESVTPNLTDGTMLVRFSGTDLILIPRMTTLVRTLTTGGEVAPSIALTGPTELNYNVQSLLEELSTSVDIAF